MVYQKYEAKATDLLEKACENVVVALARFGVRVPLYFLMAVEKPLTNVIISAFIKNWIIV